MSDPDEFYPHSLRAMFITSLANDPNVSVKETMASSRHLSFSSSTSYMVADGESESSKFQALGMKLPPSKKLKIDNADDDGEFTYRAVDSCIFFSS